MHLTLRTLGTLQATTLDAQGAQRTLGRGKPVAMLAYLACIPGHKASREHLSALLWGDVDSEAARQNLRQTIWYLKKKLGDGLLDVTGEMVGLSVPCTCDRDEFLQAAQRADFAGAMRNYAGPFIPDFAAPGASEFEQFCELERRRLMVTFLRCADALARQWLSEGKFRDAQELARRARDVDPMDQGTWRLLLEALIAGSDGLGAMTEAEHFEAFLAREGQEIEAASIAALRSARRSPAVRAPGDARPSSSIAAELVGRETEFSHVLAAWEQARGGVPRVIVMSAAAGLGKSRLLRDLQARLRASRSRCALLRANPGDRHLSGGFAAVVASELAALPGAAAVSTGSAGVLVSLAPALASLYTSATPDASDGEDAVRRRAFALVDLLHAVSDEHPVAVLLDDLHWADEHSARVIAAALSRLERARLLVVLAKRPVADPHAMFSSFEQLQLPPLDLSAVTAFVSQVAELPATPWADVLPQQLLLATGGSPLLLVETLHDALEQGWLSVSEHGTWECDDPLGVTNTLREGSALQQRTMRLPACAQRILLVLSLVGRPIEVAEAIGMASGDPQSLEEQVETLERGGFLLRTGSQVMVAHDEIADAVTQAASDADRRTVHAAIAREIFARADDDVALRRVVEHAAVAGENTLIHAAWTRFLASRRRQGDRRPTRRVAADFLGVASEQRTVLDLVAATPWIKRQRTGWLVAAGILFTVALGAATAWPRTPTAVTADFAVWVVDSVTGVRNLVGVRIDPDAPWKGGNPIQATALDSTDFPRVAERGNVIITRLPDEKRWWLQTTVPQLGDEAIIIDSLGAEHLPLRNPGDDGIADVSPDGRRLVALTARFDTVTDHMQVVTVDVTGGALKRLTFSPDYEREATWRPDGTQIAFRRHYYEAMLRDRVCVVDVDGTHERCLDVDAGGDFQLNGWLDERRVLVNYLSGAFVTLDVTSGKLTPIEGIAGRVFNWSGDLRLCLCHTSDQGEASLYVFRTPDLMSARPVLYRGRPLRGAVAILASTYRNRDWLDTLRIRAPGQSLSVDNVYHLGVEGRRANGAPAWLHELRWTSRDTSVATVDSTGRIRPRRVGATWIVVSAGGWRTDSTLARIAPPTSHTVIQEAWTSDWGTRWQRIGIPEPMLVATERGPALLPNGDGSYPSGAYSRRVFTASSGAGVEALVRLPITRSQWQTLQVQILDGGVLKRFDEWDRRTGPGPAHGVPCGFAAPGDEGAIGLGFATVQAEGSSRPFLVASDLYKGGWHRLRVQLLEDGRCGIAIDGKAMGIVAPRSRGLPATVILNIMGHDRFGGRLVVGPLQAWSGVRGGVDWTVLDADSTTKKP